jgi:predicted site-specific integrase-resolvase
MNDLITKQQAAVMFGVTERTIETWMKTNVITPYSKINGRVRFSKREILKMVKHRPA